jgi:hypothetical protein
VCHPHHSHPAQIETTVPGSQTYYTENGLPPSSSSTPTFFRGSVGVLERRSLGPYRVQAITVKAGSADSIVVSREYDLQVQVPLPSVTPLSRIVGVAQDIKLGATPGATIRYTIDGSKVSESSASVMDGEVIAFQEVGDVQLRLRAEREGFYPSETAVVDYDVRERVAAPVVSPAGGTYSDQVSVMFECATPEANILYRLDGLNPTLTAPTLAVPPGVTVLLNSIGVVNLKVQAITEDMAPSPIVAVQYELVRVLCAVRVCVIRVNVFCRFATLLHFL